MSVAAEALASCPQVLTLREPPSSGEPVRLAILDRDGTINVDAGYSHDPRSLGLTPWIVEAARGLQKGGWTIVVASNQSGVARGYFGNDQVRDFNQAAADALAASGVAVHEFVWCPHAPADDCPNRKPQPGMLLWLLARWNGVDAVFIGDSESDREAAEKASIEFLPAGSDLPDLVRGRAE